MHIVVAGKIQVLNRMGPSMEKLQALFSAHSGTVTFGYRIIGFPVWKLKVTHLGHGEIELTMHFYSLGKQHQPAP